MPRLLRHFALSAALAMPLAADLAWLDLDDPAGTTAQFHTSLPAAEGAATTVGGVTFTVFGGIGGSRDRGLADPMLSDFAFKDGASAAVGNSASQRRYQSAATAALPSPAWNAAW